MCYFVCIISPTSCLKIAARVGCLPVPSAQRQPQRHLRRLQLRDHHHQARALFREEDLPQEEATSLQLPALLARVRAVASERRSREESLAAELVRALAALEESRGGEGESRGLADRLSAEAEETSVR